MSPDEVTPNTETVEPEAQAATEPEATPDEWDKERAKATILKLRAIEAQARKDEKELAALKAEKQKQIEANLSETERLKVQAENLAKENAKLQAEIICKNVGLPETFAERLKGSTREEMQADAESLVKALPQAVAKPTPKVSATNPANAGTQITDDERRAFLGLRH